MYTDSTIVHDDKPGYRSYVTFTVNGERFRYYNGRIINLACFPNKAKNLADKLRLLKQLQFEFRKKLEKGWIPSDAVASNPYTNMSILETIKSVLFDVEQEDISDRYRCDLKRVGEELITFTRNRKLNSIKCQNITPVILEQFLATYKTSATYYMTKRSSLAGLFTRIVRRGIMQNNPAWKTSRMKSVAVLNEAFSKEELRRLLHYLQEKHARLYLCALLMFGCFLRPHREVRQLKRRHLSDDVSIITLSGSENKGKRIRIIRVPTYVQDALRLSYADTMEKECYLITGSFQTFNPDYFKTVWGRLKKEMATEGLIRRNHTMYSFRHTGAIELYQKTKDPYKVQQAMGHSSLTVTLTYLRSLGISSTVAADTPDL